MMAENTYVIVPQKFLTLFICEFQYLNTKRYETDVKFYSKHHLFYKTFRFKGSFIEKRARFVSNTDANLFWRHQL